MKLKKEKKVLEPEEDLSDGRILAHSLKNPAYFERIVVKYQPAFLRKILYLLKDPEAAEDIVQDAFVKIYKNAAAFHEDTEKAFNAWAYKILLNTCWSYARKQKREKLLFDVIDQESLDLTGSRLNADFEKKLDLDYFTSIVSRLPLVFRKILTLSVIQGKSQKEIADMEGISMGLVRTRLSRARAYFKKYE